MLFLGIFWQMYEFFVKFMDFLLNLRTFLSIFVATDVYALPLKFLKSLPADFFSSPCLSQILSSTPAEAPVIRFLLRFFLIKTESTHVCLNENRSFRTNICDKFWNTTKVRMWNKHGVLQKRHTSNWNLVSDTHIVKLGWRCDYFWFSKCREAHFQAHIW